MSMLSAQIDRLRRAAQNCRDMGKYEAEQMLREAADTIWQLRDDLQRVNAENIKLRQELALREASEQEKVIEYLRQENVDWEDMYRALKAENAKLRELLSVMAYCNQFRRECDECRMNGADGIITERAGCDELLARLRELGVEVTE